MGVVFPGTIGLAAVPDFKFSVPIMEIKTMLEQVTNVIDADSPVDNMIETLRNLLVTRINTELKSEEIDADASILEGELGLDSIMLVEFISLLEDRFDLTFGESELTMDVFTNLRTLAEFLVSKGFSYEH